MAEPVSNSEGPSDLLAALKQILESSRRLNALVESETARAELQCIDQAVSDLSDQIKRRLDIDPSGTIAFESDRFVRNFKTNQQTAVLLVEADDEWRRTLYRRLGSHGYLVSLASRGEEALKLLSERHFDLVLASDSLPDMSGFTFSEKVRQTFEPQALPVILIGESRLAEEAGKVMEVGANDMMTHPLNIGMLCVRMETHLALARTLREVAQLNGSLHQAQEEILRLEDRALDALKDVGAWTKTMSRDLGRTLGTDELGVWVWEGEKMKPITSANTRPPTGPDLMMAVRSPHHHWVRPEDVVVGIIGMTGELFGGIIVPDKTKKIGDTQLRLLSSFARQLGGALELQRMRSEIDEAEFEKQAARQQMQERGIDLVKICQWCGYCYGQEVATCPEDGVKLSATRLLPYRIQNRYRFVKKLAVGGMGTVFVSHDESLDREVAVKILNQQHFHNTQAHLRFEHEAKSLARIEHPNVITVFDSGRLLDGSVFIVMERLRGYALDKTLEKWGRGSPQQVAVLLRQGAAALTAAHQASLLHRDMKPENLFLVETPNGYKVKLLDFGIAKNMQIETTITQAGILIGTPAYMAPEQINGQPADARSDLYSLAAVCYEALTGRPVTLEKELGMVIVDIVDNDPPAPSSLLPGLPAAVDEAFAWALSKLPEDRPPSPLDWIRSFVDVLEVVRLDNQEWPFQMQQRKPSSR